MFACGCECVCVVPGLVSVVRVLQFPQSHLYNIDLFNEMNPSSNDPTYLHSISSAVYSALKAADDKAVWVMQGWLFANNPEFWGDAQIKAFLSGVPPESMLMYEGLMGFLERVCLYVWDLL